MLILSRIASFDPDETKNAFVIAGEILVRVLEIRGNEIKLGIEAPRDIEILRAELLER